MYLIFEYLFYLGLALLGIGILWLLSNLVRWNWRRWKLPLALMLLGMLAIAAPTLYTRYLDVDLGPRQAFVQGEKHLTLTGWDGESYSFLQLHPETIVLQMANPDVTDDTLDYLEPMANLRELDLNDTKVSDEGLKKLSKLTGLEVLRLRGTNMTDRGLTDYLSRLPQLKNLDLRGTFTSSDAVDAWKKAGEGRRAFH